MRISTGQMYVSSVDAMNRQSAELLHTQSQISANKRILTPADDPVAAAQALTVSQSNDQLTQFSSNVDTAKGALALSDSVYSQITGVLQAVRTTTVNAGSGTLSDADRASLATDLSSQLQELIGLANSKDGVGHYLFSGFQANTAPFVQSASGAITYNGDQGQRNLQVSTSRTLAVSENGSTVFEQVKTGNGTFLAAASPSNAGGGIVGTAQVVDPSAVNGHSYSLQFHASGTATTYDVVDSTTATTLSSGNAYADGTVISVGGEQVTISGAPADGDSFSLTPSTTQSVFTSIQNLITTLRTPAVTLSDRAGLANTLNQGLQNIDQALGNVLTVQAAGGASLRELDTITSANADRALQYQQTLSNLQDLDYNKALSDFARQQLALTAAQKSFAQVSGLSLFNYLTT